MLEELFALRRFGMELGLERMERLLERLGNPHRAYRVIHIAGTNGKGSTAAFTTALCRAAVKRTGLYTSPHLSRFTERIRVDGEEIPQEQLVRLFERVRREAAAVAGLEGLTFFEIVTALAFVWFQEARVEVAVIEVGLGGRLDATNVVDPAVAVVTGIALDHQEVLGNTLEEIAREKAGIFKRGRPAVYAAEDERARQVLAGEATAHGAEPIREHGRDFGGPGDGDRPLGLAGPHQRTNAALAIEAVRFVAPELGAAERDAALAWTRWPGRLERIAERPDVLVDCAHNPDGARALARALAPRAFVLLVGVASDKDAEGLLAALRPLAAEAVVTEPRSARARSAQTLAVMAERELGVPVLCEPVPARALDLARERASRRGLPVLACGSIFLVGPIRELCLGETPDPVVVSDPNFAPGSSGR